VYLVAQSEHFKALLYSGMKESQQNVYPIKDVSAKAFRIFLEFIYTGSIIIQDLHFELLVEMVSIF
jgi:BTB/POZ domain-containing protein 9